MTTTEKPNLLDDTHLAHLAHLKSLERKFGKDY